MMEDVDAVSIPTRGKAILAALRMAALVSSAGVCDTMQKYRRSSKKPENNTDLLNSDSDLFDDDDEESEEEVKEEAEERK